MTQFQKYSKAQTAMELAAFGAIVIFVVGLIARQALGTSYMQNQQLKAMRMAMQRSFQASQASPPDTSRNTSSILFIEDRLTANSAKYGAIDRTPYIVSGSATHNKNLFMPPDNCGDMLSYFDVIVNGRELSFRPAACKDVDIASSCAGRAPCPLQCGPSQANTDCSSTSPHMYPAPGYWRPDDWNVNCRSYSDTCLASCITAGCTTCCNPPDDCTAVCVATDLDTGICVQEASQTAVSNSVTTCVCGDGSIPVCPTPCTCNDGSSAACTTVLGAEPTFTTTLGCMRLYKIQPNLSSVPGYNASIPERFDLDRDGVDSSRFTGPDNDPDVPAVGLANRDIFSWQWAPVDGLNETWDDVTGNGIVYCDPAWDNCNKETRNTHVDVDGDLKYETVVAMSQTAQQIITRVTVLDAQDGDMDLTWDKSDVVSKPQPGLQKETRMYTRVKGGTYLMIDEGRLFAPDTRQFIRTTQKSDKIDIVERIFRLSNDTGRFCPGGSPQNGVEACNNCFSSGNISRTCMDTTNRLIFIRSRVANYHGRKWITDTSGDSYVNFSVPSAP